MDVNAELDRLLRERFGISVTDFVAVLKTLPAQRPWAAALTEELAQADADYAAGNTVDGEELRRRYGLR